MPTKQLTFILGLLFALFAVWGMLVESAGSKDILGGLSMISLGGFALSLAWGGVVDGEIEFYFDRIKRVDRPRAYWAAVTLVSVTGAVVIIGGFWVIFFKN